MIARFRQWSPLAVSALMAALIALFTILTALAFEHIGGYAPCHLCLQERYAYYFGVPAAAIAFGLASNRPDYARLLLALVGLAFLANAALSVYHTGVEWKWWAGPSTCAGGTGVTDWRELAEQLKATSVVRCDEPALKLFGLSLAFWNVLVSALIVAIAAHGVLQRAWPRTGPEGPDQGSSSVSQ